MAEKKKGQKADFAKDKGAFNEGGSAKGTGTSQRGQQKKSGTHQPRDADRTSGQNVQRSEQTETFGQNVQKSAQKPDSRSHKSRQKKQYQKQDTFGQSDKKSEDTDTGSKKKTDFSQENSTFTEENGEKQEERQPGDDYRRRDTYHQSEKREDTAGGSIRKGKEPRPLILSVIFRRRTQLLQREWVQSFMAARS